MIRLLALALALSGCDPAPTPADDDDSAPHAARAVLLYGAYTGDATVATADLEGGTLDDDLLGLAGSDWVVKVADSDPWLIGRYGSDVVRRYPGLDLSAPSLEFSTGSLSNPQSLAVCGGKLFVSRYGATPEGGGDVAVYDLATGGPRGRIDLSAFLEGTDASPEPHAIVQDGDRLYVGLQRLDTNAAVWTPAPQGAVVAIDCADEAVVASWDTGPNPFISRWQGEPFALLIKTDDGLQRLDPRDDGVEDLFATDRPGAVNGAAATGDSVLFALRDEDAHTTTVLCLDRAGGPPTELETHTSWGLGFRAAPDGTVWALWRDHWTTPDADDHGFARYDPAACASLGPWLRLAAEPLDVAFLP